MGYNTALEKETKEAETVRRWQGSAEVGRRGEVATTWQHVHAPIRELDSQTAGYR